jgi:HPt (histidine-containing phosphotransfer) domain-containing protein
MRMRNNEQPVDLVHLGRYTGGDRSLNQEILGLFEKQCYEILAQLEAFAKESGAKESGASKAWREITHTLKGAARGIGAFDLADAAADAEKTQLNDRQALLAAVHRIKGKSCAVQLFIEAFLKGEG